MKRMVDNKKFEELESKAESIGANQYIVSTNGKRYYSRIDISYGDSDIPSVSVKAKDYFLKKHITEDKECDDLEELLSVMYEYCGDIEKQKDFDYNSGFVYSSFSSSQFGFAISQNGTSVNVDKNTSFDLCIITITDLTTGKYIMIDA